MPLELKVDREHPECRTVNLGEVLDAAKARGVRRLVLTIGGLSIEADFGEAPMVPVDMSPAWAAQDEPADDDIYAAHSGVAVPSREEIEAMRKKRGRV